MQVSVANVQEETVAVGLAENSSGAKTLEESAYIVFLDIPPAPDGRRLSSLSAFKRTLRKSLNAKAEQRNNKIHLRGIEKFKEDGYRLYEGGDNIVIERLPEISAAIVYGVPENEVHKLGLLGVNVFDANAKLTMSSLSSSCGPASAHIFSDAPASEPCSIQGRDDPLIYYHDKMRTRTLVAKSKRTARIGLIDTAVDLSHVELAKANVSRAPDELCGSTTDKHGTAIGAAIVGKNLGISPASQLIVCPLLRKYSNATTNGNILDDSWACDTGKLAKTISWLLSTDGG